jgi:hypothetical protein
MTTDNKKTMLLVAVTPADLLGLMATCSLALRSDECNHPDERLRVIGTLDMAYNGVDLMGLEQERLEEENAKLLRKLAKK